MKALTLTILIVLFTHLAIPCSMFKITMYGKTMVGNNEDAWRINSKIWFESRKNGKYGAAYVGHNDLFPQGGMNEAGLCYDGFTVYPRALQPVFGKKETGRREAFIRMIMQNCGTVEEVQRMVNQFDRRDFNGAMFLFVDKSGKYLVVEVDTTIIGNDQKYVLSNFCPSLTKNTEDIRIGRYIRGRKYLENKSDTSLAFCLSVMDTMHECRTKLGDGTTYTSIYDLDEGLIYLYFYHDFEHVVKYNLQDELKKGDHSFLMTTLFPPNKEYLAFTKFKTPYNDAFIRWLVFLAGVYFTLSMLYFIAAYLRGKPILTENFPGLRARGVYLWLSCINLMLAIYLFILLTNLPIFYFDTPYSMDGRFLLNLSSYIPFALMIMAFPVAWLNIRILKKSVSPAFINWLFTINTCSYILMLGLFAYWGLLSIF